MRLYVWAPGILGSSLRQQAGARLHIWPPGEIGAFTSRTYQQLTSDLRPHAVIDSICGLAIYSPITDLFRSAGIGLLTPGNRPNEALLPYPYDWRLGIAAEADRLATLLEQVTADGDEIVIVAHSMGGLLARYLLEALRYQGRPFRSRVRKWVAINSVLLGAPVMLARAFGLEPTEFIVWRDQPRLLAQAPFSGSYSLMPAPWLSRLFNEQSAIDIYDPYYHTKLGLGPENMADAASVWQDIKSGVREPQVEYVLITSRLDDQTTISAVRFHNGAWVREYGLGDGDVPPWSSQGIPDATITNPIPGEHLGILGTQAFRALFSAHIAKLPAPTAGQPTLFVQPLKQHLRPGSVAELAVIREAGLGTAEGTLAWTPVDRNGLEIGPAVRTESMAVPDKPAPTIRSRVPDAAGTYTIRVAVGHERAETRVSVRSSDDPAPPKPSKVATRRTSSPAK